MQSYRVDFTMNQEHEMTIDREFGIFREELDEIELRMLQHAHIPHFLPMDWFEMDGKVSFRYKLSGMKMLLHRLQQQPLTMEQYYTLILGVTDALCECRHYMLRPEGCLLDEQYIFIGDDLNHIRLAYVPMKAGASEQILGSGDLLSLVVRFTSYIEQIDGFGLKRVLHPLSVKRWPLAELRSTLLELIGETRAKPSAVMGYPAREPEQHPKSIEARPQLFEEEVRPPIQAKFPLESNDLDENKAEPSFQAVNAEYADILLADEEEMEDDEPDTKRKWIISAGIIIAIACIWRFVYFTAETRQSLLISSGLTLLILAFMLFVWRRKGGNESIPQDEEFEWRQQEPGNGILPGIGKRDPAELWRETENTNSAASSKPGLMTSASPLHVVAANVAASKVEPTVFLGRDASPFKPDNEPELWLQRSWEGQVSRLVMEEDFFRIGRMGEQLSYEEIASGVSRLHLEIEMIEGEYKAKDLGSRNGSLLNGQSMIPYKSYKLAVGDIIHLAGETGPSYELKQDEG